MKISNLRFVNRNTIIPFYSLEIGKTFYFMPDIPMVHICIYTKVSDNIIRCDHGSVEVNNKILVRPLA